MHSITRNLNKIIAYLNHSVIFIYTCTILLQPLQAEETTPQQQPALRLTSNQTINLSPHLLYFADSSGQLSIAQLLNHSEIYWQIHKEDIPNFGYTNIAYWFYIRLKNNTDHSLSQLIAINYPLLDNSNIYTIANKKQQHIKLDDKQPFSARPILHRNFLVPIEFSPLQEQELYIRVKTQSSMQVPIELISQQELLEKDQLSLTGQGIYFGIMIAMVFYNLFLWLSLRDTSYLLYISSVICVALVQATLRGYSYEWLWPNSPTLQHYHMPIIVSLSGATVAFFSLHFLNLYTLSRRYFYTVLTLALVLCINALASPFTGYPIAVRIGVGATTIYAVVGLLSGIRSWRSGFQPAIYFTGAYFVLFAGTLIIALNKFGLLPRNFFTENVQEIGSVLEVLLLSFALANRINVLRQEKEQAQKNATLWLENKVNERTQELSQTLNELAHVNSKLARQNKEDGLTGALNRRCFDEILTQEWARCQRTLLPLSLLMLDVDHFKKLNDKHGHLTGDDCLQKIAECLKTTLLRPDDKAFRYGGEEFAVILPNTDLEGALSVAERIRENIALQVFKTSTGIAQLTCSFGVATHQATPLTNTKNNPQSMQELMLCADQCLYLAKNKGRNCVVGDI